MNNHVNIEAIKIETKIWYEAGRNFEFQRRSDDEISSYMDALETAIRISLESFGHTSMAVYETHRTWHEIDEYIQELINKSSEEWYKIENGE